MRSLLMVIKLSLEISHKSDFIALRKAFKIYDLDLSNY